MSAALAWFILPRLSQFFLGEDSVHKSCPSGLAITGPMVFSACEDILDFVPTSARAVTQLQ